MEDIEDLKEKERETEIFAKSKHIVKDPIETVETTPDLSFLDSASSSETDLAQSEDQSGKSSADDSDDQFEF